MELFDPHLLDNLLHLPSTCIYGFINEYDKKIYIGFSCDLLLALYRNLKDIKYSNHPCKKDFKKLKLIIIETLDNKLNSRIRYQYWVNKYSNMGYKNYRNFKASSYKVRVDVLRDFRMTYDRRFLFYVKLRTRHGKEFIVGVFDKVEDAELFVTLNYTSIDDIIYAGNKLTKEYLKKESM